MPRTCPACVTTGSCSYRSFFMISITAWHLMFGVIVRGALSSVRVKMIITFIDENVKQLEVDTKSRNIICVKKSRLRSNEDGNNGLTE